ncbi:MAG: tetratricopeptide repeat protein [Candidatus Brocadia sp.]|nr:tetratricopeptide repeat protein [Candidatus Brocadia sp.]
MQHSFVYDDESTIINNYFIRQWSNLSNLFTRKYFVLSAELTYRPVVTLSYFIDHTFWHLNPLGYHLTNILLHAANSTLLFVFAFQIFKKRTTAFISALFFSSYPIFSEVVNAVGFREDLLAFLFLILAFIFYLESNKRRYILYYSLSLFCYFLSLFSKEMAITLPLLIVLFDVVFQGLLLKKTFSGGESRFSYFKPKFPHYYMGFILITIFYILNRFFFFYNPSESQISYPHDSLFVNFLAMTRVVAYYVKLLFLPFQLNADYVVPFSASPAETSFWLSGLLLIVIGIVTFRLRSQHRYVFFFILWFFVTLIPVMNSIPLGNIMAERYLYIPGAGFSMIIANLLSKLSKQGVTNLNQNGTHASPFLLKGGKLSSSLYPSPLPAGGGGIRWGGFSPFFNVTGSLFVFILFFILTGNAYLTCKRNNDWKDGLQLWSKTVLTSPNSFRAHINLGNAYEKRGFNASALEKYNKALTIDPNDADVYNNIGIYYDKMNLSDEAIQYYEKCLAIDPRHTKAHNNLGVVFTRQRRFDDAIQAFSQAISINPLYPDAHNNLGIVYYRKGLINEAEREFKLTISIEPYHAEAHNDLGILYNDKHQYDDAIHEFETAIQIKPDYANAHMNLGAVILKHRKDRDTALFHLKESLKIDPQQEQAMGIKKLIEQLEDTTE